MTGSSPEYPQGIQAASQLLPRMALVFSTDLPTFAGLVFSNHTSLTKPVMKTAKPKIELSAKQRDELLNTLQTRFEHHMERHQGMEWAQVKTRLEANAAKLGSLHLMEETGGEPDVVGLDKKSGEYVFFDCSPQSPKGRYSLCYDGAALAARKEHKPKDSAMELAEAMGIDLLDEEQYIALQKLGEFDTKTSSWVKTPDAMRKLGGALFGDRRFGRVFFYHNGAESYYSGRGFRGSLRV